VWQQRNEWSLSHTWTNTRHLWYVKTLMHVRTVQCHVTTHWCMLRRRSDKWLSILTTRHWMPYDVQDSTDILRRVGLASLVMGQLDRVWRQNRLSLATKLRIYSTCVLAVGLHGAETWTLLKEDSRRLQAFHVTCQRRILGIRWNDFITNRAVSDSTNLPSILSTLAARRHSIFCHIHRLPDRYDS